MDRLSPPTWGCVGTWCSNGSSQPWQSGTTTGAGSSSPRPALKHAIVESSSTDLHQSVAYRRYLGPLASAWQPSGVSAAGSGNGSWDWGEMCRSPVAPLPCASTTLVGDGGVLGSGKGSEYLARLKTHVPCLDVGARGVTVCAVEDVQAARAAHGVAWRDVPPSLTAIRVNGGASTSPLPAASGISLFAVPWGLVTVPQGAVWARRGPTQVTLLRLGMSSDPHASNGFSSLPRGSVLGRYPKLMVLWKMFGDWRVHFLWELLPLADFVTEFLVAHPDVHILVPECPSCVRLLTRLWEPFGVTAARFVVVPWTSLPERQIPGSFLAQELYYPALSPLGFGALRYPHCPSRFYRALSAQGAVESQPHNVVLYLSRGPRRRRSVRNEGELVAAMRAALRPHLELVVVEDPDPEEEEVGTENLARLAFRAQAIVGPHGGALQNMVHLRLPGTYGVANWTSDALVGDTAGMGPGDPIPAVVELGAGLTLEAGAQFSHTPLCFVHMAAALGLRHWMVGHSDLGQRGGFDANITATLHALHALGLTASVEQPGVGG